MQEADRPERRFGEEKEVIEKGVAVRMVEKGALRTLRQKNTEVIAR